MSLYPIIFLSNAYIFTYCLQLLTVMAEEAILGFLHENHEIADSGKFATQSGLSHDDIVNVVKSLSAFHFVEAQVSIFYINFIVFTD